MHWHLPGTPGFNTKRRAGPLQDLKGEPRPGVQWFASHPTSGVDENTQGQENRGGHMDSLSLYPPRHTSETVSKLRWVGGWCDDYCGEGGVNWGQGAPRRDRWKIPGSAA